ncbi:hypothetical protein PRK78_003341 [Emydomyces testavorans]|uniref:Uncharacterized protein n=1 Tax=Emydomyces testavorans TaxID=2070801 RepID=A0AAF0DGQ6_9EURO|nr:hypothetical protein PRK78_003341 [Emydomyces testavorans]
MTTLTCPDDSEPKHASASTIRDSAITSPFLYVPSTLQNDGPADHKFDITVSPLLIAGTLPPRLSFVSDSRSFYTAFEVTDINVKPSQSPTFTDSQTSSPQLTFSGDSTEDEEEMENLLRPSDQTIPLSNTESLAITSQTSLEHESEKRSKARRKLPSSPKERRSKSQTPTTSRSSSVSCSRSAGHRNRPGPYRQLQSPRAAGLDNQFKPHREERDLLALHRESCRLFESFGAPAKSPAPLPDDCRPVRSSTEPPQSSYPTRTKKVTRRSSAGSPSLSPLLHTSPSILSSAKSTELPPDPNQWDPVLGPQSTEDTQTETVPAYKMIPPTVIDWTSASTRRREYEKIDRSSRGIRGMWRRFAPKWCQSKSQRIPFFDETKKDKQLHEGSVRRFRMDIPDDVLHQGKRPVIVAEKEKALKAKCGWMRLRFRTSDDDSDRTREVRTPRCFGL